MTLGSSYIKRFGLGRGGVACIVGAGGKTSLMFHLAKEAKEQGYSSYVSTTTRMLIPAPRQYDECNLSGKGFTNTPLRPGVYVAGRPVSESKMQGVSLEILAHDSQLFDILFLEADGAAGKSLKGWLPTEPVIPLITTHTIGVVDISTVGRVVRDDLVHRLDRFCAISGAKEGELVTVGHLYNMITHKMGLFFQAKGHKVVFINKVESPQGQKSAKELLTRLTGIDVIVGSVQQNTIVDCR